MRKEPFEIITPVGGTPIKCWTKGVAFDEAAKLQVQNLAWLPFIHRWIAVMQDHVLSGRAPTGYRGRGMQKRSRSIG